MTINNRAGAFTAVVMAAAIARASAGMHAQAPLPNADLAGTSWQLVEFQSSDDTKLIPDDRAKYTLAFGADNQVSVRIDCNRGSGTWTSSGPSQVQFGPLALTRALCPPGSLHDRIVKQLPFVRSYVMRGGHLFLALMADGGIYEFEPIERATPAEGQAVGPLISGIAMYKERIALPLTAVLEATLEDVSRADAPAEVVARTRRTNPGNPPIQFEIAYDPDRIQANRSYVVRARILVGETLMFTTDTAYPVLTRGNTDMVSVMMRHVGGGQPAPPGAQGAVPTLELPATFVGDLPCADCPGIRYHLNVLPDQTFFLRLTYQERNATLDDGGRWLLSSDRRVLLLKGRREATLMLAVQDSATLRLLDIEGDPIASTLNYDLKRAARVEPIEPQPGLADVQLVAAPLETTYWRATQLAGKLVAPGDANRQAHLVFEANARVAGSDGCNRVAGSYELAGDAITFGMMMGTQMACADTAETERAFRAALTGASAWRILGDRLELYDAAGIRLARFEAQTK